MRYFQDNNLHFNACLSLKSLKSLKNKPVPSQPAIVFLTASVKIELYGSKDFPTTWLLIFHVVKRVFLHLQYLPYFFVSLRSQDRMSSCSNFFWFLGGGGCRMQEHITKLALFFHFTNQVKILTLQIANWRPAWCWQQCFCANFSKHNISFKCKSSFHFLIPFIGKNEAWQTWLKRLYTGNIL